MRKSEAASDWGARAPRTLVEAPRLNELFRKTAPPVGSLHRSAKSANASRIRQLTTGRVRPTDGGAPRTRSAKCPMRRWENYA